MSIPPRIVATRIAPDRVRIRALNRPHPTSSLTLYRAPGYRAALHPQPIASFIGDEYEDGEGIAARETYKYAATFDNGPLERYFEIVEDHRDVDPIPYVTVEPLPGVSTQIINETWTFLGVQVDMSFIRVAGGTFEGKLSGPAVSIGENQAL